MKKKEFPPFEFTKIAKQGLSKVRSDSSIENIRKGDEDTLLFLFEDLLKNTYTFGHFLKRYISQKEGFDYESFTDEQLKSFLKTSFAKNGLKNQGSLEFGTTSTLTKTLSRCLSKPVSRIDRKTCFLFFFGLDMNRREASGMLTKEFLQADFNIRNPKEVIYLYCLKHHLKYDGILLWLEKYNKIICSSINYLDTMSLGELFEPILSSQEKNDAQFLQYLTILKGLSSSRHNILKAEYQAHFLPVSTRERTYKNILSTLEYVLSDKRKTLRDRYYQNLCMYEDMGINPDTLRSAKDFQKAKDKINFEKSKNERLYQSVNAENLANCLDKIDTSKVVIPKVITQLLKEEILEIPDITADKIKHRLDKSSVITREDLLVSTFMLCTFDFPPSEKTLIDTFRNRRLVFEEAAEIYLTECSFHKLYLRNPLELFLVSCLFYENPLTYFLAVLRHSRQITQEKNQKKDPNLNDEKDK